MHEPPHDERIRHLQRIAYGAVASDAERAAALAELESLRRAQASVTDTAPAAASTHERTPTGSTRAVSEWIAVSDAASVRRFRLAVATGTAALLVGIAVGWHFGSRLPVEEPTALATPTVPADTAAFIPVAETAMPRLFDTEPTAADVPAFSTLDERIAPSDYRLLVTRPDGVALHVARLGGDVCVVVVAPDWGTASGCTAGGSFPKAGLWVQGEFSGTSIRAELDADGTAALTPVEYLPPEGLAVARG